MKRQLKDEGGAVFVGRLRRDLGTLESYAALLGILIGAGIFTVTSHAWALTGPSVILGYVVLTPVVLATSVPYGAFLASALADYVIEFAGGRLRPETYRLPLALAGLVFFYLVHVVGVRWFGRIQVAMCALLGLSLVVLIVPGLFAVRAANYRPFVTHGL